MVWAHSSKLTSGPNNSTATFQSDENNDVGYGDDVDDEEDEIIRGLTNVNLDGSQAWKVTPKGPVFRRNETDNRAAPYQGPVKDSRCQSNPTFFQKFSKEEGNIFRY
jgi:hypothetical protein